MTATEATPLAPPGWVCPFCPLHCEPAGVVATATGLALDGVACARADAGWADHLGAAGAATALIDGQPASTADAIAAAAQRLGAAGQALIGGLGTEVAGSRAAYRLAHRLGAVVDHAHGEALTAGNRTLQDRGLFYTTLGELRSRADLIVCIGTQPAAHYPAFWSRIGAGHGGAGGSSASELQRVIFLGADADPALPASVHAQTVALDASTGDLHGALAQLNALAAGRKLAAASGALRDLATALKDARYAALVWEPTTAGPYAALVGEAVLRLVSTLNVKGRAASFSLGGSDGSYTAQQAMAWLGGFPLRTRIAPEGLRHEPGLYGTERLLAEGAVDALVWIAATGSHLVQPKAPSLGYRVVIGHPALAASAQQAGDIFIPVAQAGLCVPGHAFRMDGGIVLPLMPLADTARTRLVDDGLPSVADVLKPLEHALIGQTARAGALA
jgi:formylmethanofuran dehydrogenase subunit B